MFRANPHFHVSLNRWYELWPVGNTQCYFRMITVSLPHYYIIYNFKKKHKNTFYKAAIGVRRPFHVFICLSFQLLNSFCCGVHISGTYHYSHVFSQKKGIMCYHLSYVRRAVCPAGRQQFTSISSYTIDARITKPICMIPLCIQMLATYLKYFSVFQFWNNSDFSDFTQKCNFSVNFSRNWLTYFKCMGRSHIQHISNGFYQVTFRSPSKKEI